MHQTFNPSVSIATWIEVLAGTHTPAQEHAARRLLGRMRVIPLSSGVAEQAIHLRRERRLKLPDAVIWATALTYDLVLVTRNSKDFPADDPSIRIPYQL